MKKILSIFSFILMVLFLTGYMALSPAPKLHEVLSHNNKPLIKSNVAVTAKMNDRLTRQDTAIGVDDLVRDTIQVALKKANILMLIVRNTIKFMHKLQKQAKPHSV